MIEHIPYPSVKSLRYVEEFFQDDTPVVIQEKVDGSNVAIRRVDGQLVLQSRTQILGDSDSGIFKSFIAWAHQHEPLQRLREGAILFGETVCNQGKIKYQQQQPFVLFDVVVNDALDTPLNTAYWADRFVVPCIPILYSGTFGGVRDRLGDLIGQSAYGDRQMEGVVVKAYGAIKTWFTAADGTVVEQVMPSLAAKVVSEAFQETKSAPKALHRVADPLDAIADMLVTEARFYKAVQRAREQGKDVAKPHHLIGFVAQDAAHEDRPLVQEALYRAFWKEINGKIAQRVLAMHVALRPGA